MNAASPALPAGVVTSWPCPRCEGKTFPSERALSNHRVKAHGEKLIPRCEVCGLTFPNSSRLGAHRRRDHPEEARKRAEAKKHEGSLICGLCGLTFSSIHLLCEHLVKIHQEPAHVDQREFRDWDEFEAWKNEVETLDAARFVRKQGSVIPTKFAARHYFDCHRSGKTRLLPQDQRQGHRANNLHPTRKIGFHCSAHIYVTVAAEPAVGTRREPRVSVIYCRHHYGHDRALHWLPMPSEARELVQGLLKKGRSREDAFLAVQEESSRLAAAGHPNAQRFARVTRHDIANVQKQLDSKAGRGGGEQKADSQPQPGSSKDSTRSKVLPQGAGPSVKSAKQPSKGRQVPSSSSQRQTAASLPSGQSSEELRQELQSLLCSIEAASEHLDEAGLRRLIGRLREMEREEESSIVDVTGMGEQSGASSSDLNPSSSCQSRQPFIPPPRPMESARTEPIRYPSLSHQPSNKPITVQAVIEQPQHYGHAPF